MCCPHAAAPRIVIRGGSLLEVEDLVHLKLTVAFLIIQRILAKMLLFLRDGLNFAYG